MGYKLPCPVEVNPDKLSLALEPEVAAIYSQQVTAKEVLEAGTSSFLKPNGNYIVVDIGGGTVDITAQGVVDGGIEILTIPVGNDWGGTQVNEQFSTFLAKLVQDPNFSSFLSSDNQIQYRAILNKLLYHEFELQKYQFGNRILHDDEMIIDIPNDIIKFYGATKLRERAESVPGVEFDNDSLYIKKEVVEEILFGPPVNGIVSFMMTILDNYDHHIDTMYLIGGFGGCKYLYETLRREIHKKFSRTICSIIVPTSPKLAVAVGAVMWRKNPDLIKARKVDATYGINVSILFNDDKHDRHYRFYNEEQQCYRCNNIFKVFVQKGERVQSDEVFTTALTPGYQSETKAKMDIWSTPLVGVEYVKDKEGKMNVTKIGELVIDIPNPDNLPREKRVIDVTMDFSGTEIQAKAKYCVNGNEVKTVCDFLSAQIK